MIRVEDKTLHLSDGRTLAFADNGNTSSNTVVLFLHGAFSLGDASRPPAVLMRKNVHYIAPSLPGWGRSSPIPSPQSYAQRLAADFTELLTFLHPQNDTTKLYICGHSFGTVAAQMLSEQTPEIFPYIQHLAVLILIAPHSPPHRHIDYAKHLSWQGYLMSGPPARYLPFNLLGYIVKAATSSSLKTDQGSEVFARKTMFSIMKDDEREAFARWKEAYGVEEGQFERETGKTLSRSVAQSWQGFLDLPIIYHWGWGNGPTQKMEAPVLVVSSSEDSIAPMGMAKWLVDYYAPRSSLKILQGGHFASFFHMDDIWKEVLDWSE
ncbi:hypothetical protein AX16_000082 [Volvariella volvacea WC 439]|nr:hypothetical protein AX16_000082 [Volvariella volvacea WC 439]